MPLDSEDIREIYLRTRIIRKPTYGIVRGYHELPYVCLGQSTETGQRTVVIRGRIHVSPQFIIRPSHYKSSYDEVFGDDATDTALCGRIFGFMGFPRRPVECKSEHLEVTHLDTPLEDALSNVLDKMERMEDITTGVILTPDSRYYPVSIERFIAGILDEEFRV